jgi:myosin-5
MELNLRKGDKVWVEDKDLAWIAADVLDSFDNKLHVETSTGKKVFVSPEKLFRRDPDDEEHNGVDDMTKLTYLHEAGVLYNLQRRYALNDIYVSSFHSFFLWYCLLRGLSEYIWSLNF